MGPYRFGNGKKSSKLGIVHLHSNRGIITWSVGKYMHDARLSHRLGTPLRLVASTVDLNKCRLCQHIVRCCVDNLEI